MSSLRARFALATLLFAAALLTGCNASPSVAGTATLPSFFGASHGNGEAISTLGANFALPQASHHSTRLHELPGRIYPHPSGHRSL